MFYARYFSGVRFMLGQTFLDLIFAIKVKHFDFQVERQNPLTWSCAPQPGLHIIVIQELQEKQNPSA